MQHYITTLKKNRVHLKTHLNYFALEAPSGSSRKIANFPFLIKQEDVRSTNLHSDIQLFSFTYIRSILFKSVALCDIIYNHDTAQYNFSFRNDHTAIHL